MEYEEIVDNILQKEKIGWWQVDTRRGVFICSNILQQALGLEVREIDYECFIELVAAPYRNLLSSDCNYLDCERLFPMVGSRGEVWFRWKMLKNADPDIITGYAQQIEPTNDVKERSGSVEHTNSLLYRLNSISHTLLSFQHSDTIDKSVNEVLIDILKMMKASRVYISELDSERKMHVCTYEVTANGVASAVDDVNQISFEETPWWNEQMQRGKPIIFSDIADMPAEANTERELLIQQGVCSIFALPLMSHDKLWGYAGIDVVGEHRTWDNEDYQWFVSLINIVNLCIGLQRSEREAQSERDYLQSLYKYMPMGYTRLKILYDHDGNAVDYIVLDSNFAADAIIGLPREAYIDKTASELGVDVAKHLPSVIKTIQKDHFVETDGLLPGSSKTIHSILYSTLQDEITCLFSDTTEVQETHNALDRSEKLLRNIYDNIPVGIELYDKNGLMVDINKKDMEIFGVGDKADVKNINFYNNPIVPPEIRERVRQHEEFTFKLFYQFNNVGDYYETSKSGHLEIYTSVSMLYNTKGELANFMLINIDNTDINRAHSRIAEFESSFALVSRFGKVGYARFDLLTKEGFAMPQWYHNLGEREDIPLNRVIGVYSHVDPSDRDNIYDAIRKIKADTLDNFSLDLRITLDDGGEKWTRVNVIRNPLNNDPSKIEMVCVNYDITELKMTEKHLIEAKNKAEVSDRLKSAFLANMSHEIRTPLNAIVGFSGLLTETNDLEEQQYFHKIVQENNDLLLKLISDILDLSKIEAGTLEFNNTEFDVNQMCQEIVRALSIKVGDKPVELCIGDQIPNCLLVSDKTRLTQVLTNFVNNALKFTTEGKITLGFNCNNGRDLTFFVEDTGKGISDAEIDSVFGRFVKLNSFAQGTGLGLAICKSIVEQLGGEIGVTSEEGQGSRFWFTIPYLNSRGEAFVALTKEQAMYLPGDSGRQRPLILIAEDLDSNYMLLKLMLSSEFDVLRAVDGAEAVRLSREIAPDAILMDIQMPEMNGYEATRMIREQSPTMPIIAVTAFTYDQDRSKAMKAGCSDYMPKPLAGAVLKAKLRLMLKSRRSLGETK